MLVRLKRCRDRPVDPLRYTVLVPRWSRRDQLRAPFVTSSEHGRSCFGTSCAPTSGMSPLSDRVARARCQREAQGRRRPKTAGQDGATAQADDAGATAERRDQHADHHDFTPKAMTPWPLLCVCFATMLFLVCCHSAPPLIKKTGIFLPWFSFSLLTYSRTIVVALFLFSFFLFSRLCIPNKSTPTAFFLPPMIPFITLGDKNLCAYDTPLALCFFVCLSAFDGVFKRKEVESLTSYSSV